MFDVFSFLLVLNIDVRRRRVTLVVGFGAKQTFSAANRGVV